MNINWSSLMNSLTGVGLKVLLSLVVLFIAFKLINRLSCTLEKKLLDSGRTDKTLTQTLLYLMKIGLKILVIICLIGYLGIDTSGLSALIASLGVCVGLAVNGTLSNLAGGVLLLITRPFKVDDFIEAAGFTGTVEEIRIITTSLRTLDNKLVYIPNGTLSTSSIVNYSTKETRRVDLDFRISRGADFEKAEKIILDACAAHKLVLKDPAPFARVTGQEDGVLIVTMRAWAKNEDYWTVYLDLIEAVKKDFDKAGIPMPLPQMAVHMKQ